MDVLGIFLGLEHGRILAVYGGKESSQISSNIVICVLTKKQRHYRFGTT